MSQIISASRRTDIPAFYSEWLMNRLRAGSCAYWHPFSGKWIEVGLRQQDVAGIVFWTKNAGPLLPHLDRVRQLWPCYFQFTITGHPEQIEPGIIPTDEALRQARHISERFGSEALVWRFDPILHTQFAGPEDTLTRFRDLAVRMTTLTDTCIISFMSPYRRQRLAFKAAGLEFHEPSPELRTELAAQIAAAAAEFGITVRACCNDDVVGAGVLKAHCVDPERLRALGAELPGKVSKAPSRKQCGCYRSVDIGAYDMCGGGCAYCYANQNHDIAARNVARHDPGHLGLAEAFIDQD